MNAPHCIRIPRMPVLESITSINTGTMTMWLKRTSQAAFVALIFVALEVVAILVVLDGPALAHEAPPAVIDIMPLGADRLALSIDLNAPGYLARVEGVDHETFDVLPPADIAARVNNRPDLFVDTVTVVAAEGPLPVATKGVDENGRLDLVVSGVADARGLAVIPSEALGEALVRVLDPATSEPVRTEFAAPGESAFIGAIQNSRQDAVSIAQEYLVAGFDHIIPKGLDHILFVIGLFLLSPAFRPLLVQVSLFTVAHTTTLGLAAAGLITVPPAIVEPLIALSIAFIAVENMFRTSLSRWRPWVIIGFGLLHGLGFASVLADFGLPTDQFVVALAAFNIGVEAGQITVLALCFLAVGLFFGRPWYRSAISIPASLALAGIGFYWFVERVAEGLA